MMRWMLPHRYDNQCRRSWTTSDRCAATALEGISLTETGTIATRQHAMDFFGRISSGGA
jgi:hypothetical protein